MKLIAGHQPEFFPYIGYWEKMYVADKFVLVDHINYQHKNFQNRNRIRNGNGSDKICWLNIPIKRKGVDLRFVKIKDVIINDTEDWKSKHLNIIKQSYQKTKYFNEVYPFIKNLYYYETKYLSDFTSNIIKNLASILNIKNNIDSTSSKNITGQKNDLLVDICKEYNCDCYLSGMGAIDYVDLSIFKDNDLEHRFIRIQPNDYITRWKPYVENMCTLDMLFNLGFKGTENYIKNNVQYELF